MDTGRTYIVTGCTGYVGNVFAKKLLREGCRVVGYARSREKAARVFAGEKMEFVYGDIADAEAFEGCFAGGERFVVLHTAAKVSIGESSAKDVYDAAVRGTQTVTEACLRHGAKLLHVSSTEAVPRGVKLREDLSNYIPDPARVRKGYARAKSAADALVLRAARERGLDASVLLLASVLGPGDTGPGHMSQMMIEFIEGKLPASVRGGYNDFDIRDVADVLPAVVERAQAGESYLFAHKPDSINDVLAVLAEMTGRKAPPALGSAEYGFVSKPAKNGSAGGATTFCMCPGGELIPATSDCGQLSTNGMSNSDRDGFFANAAIVTAQDISRFSDAAEAFAFLDTLERKTFEAGGGDYTCPAQNAADFLRGTLGELPDNGSYVFGLRKFRVDSLLPEEAKHAIRRALKHIGGMAPGYIENGVVAGLETRVSSPIRFDRHPETQETSVTSFYAVGEGAGMAGGITSSAVDGIRIAEAMLKKTL